MGIDITGEREMGIDITGERETGKDVTGESSASLLLILRSEFRKFLFKSISSNFYDTDWP